MNNIRFEKYVDNSDIVYHTHQGFGDLLICSPIANWISDLFPERKVLFVTRSKSHSKNLDSFCYPNVKTLHLDLYPSHEKCNSYDEIKVVNEWVEKRNLSLVRSGFFNYEYNESYPWDYSFYSNIGASYEVKTSHFFVDKSLLNSELILSKFNIRKNEDFAFVHDDAKRELSFCPETNLNIVKNNDTIPLVEMCVILEKAKELHMMGSSLLCLADLLHLPNEKQDFFYYPFRGNLNSRGKEKWKIVQ